jgi:acetylcholinesterase
MKLPCFEILMSMLLGRNNLVLTSQISANDWSFQIGNSQSAFQQTKVNDSAVANVLNGTIRGAYLEEYNQHVFRGIPYTQSTAGKDRYKLPRSLNESWIGEHIHTEYSPFCVGYKSDQIRYNFSEDCLTLNVVRPASHYDKLLPVAVWIHGGGYSRGSSSDERYNLTFIVEQSVKSQQPIVAVSFNYRLGPWGFLAGAAFADAGLTNLGLRDQRLALHWIQENIYAFGGNNSEVTIWGESAGAGSVGLHMLAYGGRDEGLFRGAIMESGGPIPFISMRDQRQSQKLLDSLMFKVGCSRSQGEETLKCLREKDFHTLNNAFNTSILRDIWFPALDGDFLVDKPTKQLADGNFTHVPIIIGTNTDEGASFSPRPGAKNVLGVLRDISLTLALSPPIGSFPHELAKLYPHDQCFGIPFKTNENSSCEDMPADKFNAHYRRVAAYFGDYQFVAPRRATCEWWSKHSDQAYCYRFNAQPNGQHWYDGVKHLTEIPFVFYNLLGVGHDELHNDTQGVNPFENKPPAYTELADFMSRSWVSFVSTLNPNSWRNANDPYNFSCWPIYSHHTPEQILFDADYGTRIECDTDRTEAIKLINDHPEHWNR